MEYAFYGCTFLQFGKKIDVPNLRCVRSLESMFGDCEMFNQPIENWDVSTIESMERMFVRAYAFNQPLNGWNVSNVTTMETMFWGARALKSNRSRILGLIVPYHRCTDAPGQYRYIVSLAAACRRHGYELLVISGEEGVEGMRRLTESALCDGILVMDVLDRAPRADAAHRAPRGPDPGPDGA